MLKIVVFDGGFGGELFADRLEAELPVVEVIRVIDWRNAEKISASPRAARRIAENALRPYLGKVDLIIFANHLLSTTSLRYFQHKYKSQRFVGLTLRSKRIVSKKPTLIIATKPTARNLKFLTFARHINARTVCLDDWPLLIDDGELTSEVAQRDLATVRTKLNHFSPEQILLACGQFAESTSEFRRAFGHNVRIIDGFDDTIEEAQRVLGIKCLYKRK